MSIEALSNDQINTFNEEGFLNLGILFGLKELQNVRMAFNQALISNHPKLHIDCEDNGAIRSVMAWHYASERLRQFTFDERIVRAVQSILGTAFEIHQTKFNPKASDGRGKKWDPHRGFTFWHFLDGVPDPEKMVSVFIALTDQTEANGAVRTWKRSHLISLEQLEQETDFSGREGLEGDTSEYLSLQIREENLQRYQNELEEVRLFGEAGTVWLVHSLNLHLSEPNLSSHVRELVANVFRSKGNRPQKPRRAAYLCEPPEL